MATKLGTSGKDTIVGTKKDDYLFGGEGKDKILGLKGDDRIEGGMGNDTLTGFKGADTFVFDASSGADTITDFNANQDVIEIPSGLSGITSGNDVLALATQVGKNVVIDLGGGVTIKLKNFDLGDLKADNFDIV